jgi:hypothetical protein
MAKSWQVLKMLCPNVEYTINDENNFNSIIWHKGPAPIAKAEFEAGFAQYDAWQAEQDEAKAAKKAAAEGKLAALGLDADDLKALGLA